MRVRAGRAALNRFSKNSPVAVVTVRQLCQSRKSWMSSAVRAVVAAAHVHQRLAVRGERQIGQLLPVVVLVGGEAPGLKFRPLPT